MRFDDQTQKFNCPFARGEKIDYSKKLPLGEPSRGKKLPDARQLLKAAVKSGQDSDMAVAARAIVALPEEERDPFLHRLTTLLDNCPCIEQNIRSLRVLAFITSNLSKNGWAENNGWDSLQPVMDKQSNSLANSLYLGFLGGRKLDYTALEALSFFAIAGAADYDADTLKDALKRFVRTRGGFSGFYNTTGVLGSEGPEGLREAALEMEMTRVGHCVNQLNNSHVLEASRELVKLLTLGRQKLVPVMPAIQTRLVHIMQEPGVRVSEQVDEDDQAEAQKLADQAAEKIRTQAAVILKQIASMRVSPINLVANGNVVPSMQGAQQMFCMLAKYGIEANIIVQGGDPETAQKVMSEVPADNIRVEEIKEATLEAGPPEVSKEVSSLMYLAMHSPDEAEVGEVIDRLLGLQAKGEHLHYEIECPEDEDPEQFAIELAQRGEILSMHGLMFTIGYNSERAQIVAEHLGIRPGKAPELDELFDEGMEPQDMADRLLEIVIAAKNMDDGRVEALADSALPKLHELKEQGIYPKMDFDCSDEYGAQDQADEINFLMLDLDEMGVTMVPSFSGANADAVQKLMGTDVELE